MLGILTKTHINAIKFELTFPYHVTTQPMLNPATWSTSRLFFFRVFFLFALLFVVSFTFGYQLLPDIGDYTHRFFASLARFTGDHILSIKRSYTSGLISDSTGFYINALNILVLSVIGAIAWHLFFRKIRSHERLLYWFTVFVRYYLALQLLIYGFSKVFKAQFYLPEPNILYTPLGDVPKDLLYWSTMGVSAPYSIFLGLTEVIAALFLLFRRTTLAGAFLAFFILLNVAAINFAYDISVKLFSCFLVVLSLFLLFLHRKRIVRFFAGDMVPASHRWQPVWKNAGQRISWYAGKTIVVLLLVLESCWLYISTNNFNDDRQQRPPLHGAYHVESYIIDNDTIPPLQTNKSRWKKLFFHRHNYFIVQDMNDEMYDFKMGLDTVAGIITVFKDDAEQMRLSYRRPDQAMLLLDGKIQDKTFKCTLRRLDWQDMPLLKREFSWTID